MTEINTFDDSYTDIEDRNLDDLVTYSLINQLLANIDLWWEIFQKAHRADGEHYSFLSANNLGLAYVDADTFTCTGDFTAYFTEGRRLEIDCDTDGTKYRTVASAAHSEGTTTVTLADNDNEAITGNLTAAALSIVAEAEALPEYAGVYSIEDSANLLDASGDLTCEVISARFPITRLLLRALGDAVTFKLYIPTLIGNLITVYDDEMVFHDGFTDSVSGSVAIGGAVTVKGIAHAGVDGDLYYVAGNGYIYQCDGLDCSTILDSADHPSGAGDPYFKGMAWDGANLLVLDASGYVWQHDGVSLNTTLQSFYIGSDAKGIAVDVEGNLTAFYIDGDGDQVIVTYDGISTTIKDTRSFAYAGSACGDFCFDGLFRAMIDAAANKVYVYSDIRGETLSDSWTENLDLGVIGFAWTAGTFAYEADLSPGQPLQGLSLTAAGKFRVDVAGDAGDELKHMTVEMGR